MSHPTYRASSYFNDSSKFYNSITLTKPAGTANGDFLFCVIMAESPISSKPGGWWALP
jgi:hypothetical protein